MNNINNIEIIKVFAIILGGGFALWQYNKQTILIRAQNLDMLWTKFYSNPKFIKIFTLLNEISNNNENAKNELETLDKEDKFQFLAYLAEIFVFMQGGILKINSIDKKKANLLYKWHFKFIFNERNTYEPFWKNIGGNDERTAKDWKLYIKFADELSLDN